METFNFANLYDQHLVRLYRVGTTVLQMDAEPFNAAIKRQQRKMDILREVIAIDLNRHSNRVWTVTDDQFILKFNRQQEEQQWARQFLASKGMLKR